MLNVLRETLAELYPDEVSARRVVDQASLRASNIHFDGRATVMWASVIAYAQRNEQLLPLVEAALRDFPDHRGLLRIQGALIYEGVDMAATLRPDFRDEGEQRTYEIVQAAVKNELGRFSDRLSWTITVGGIWLGAVTIILVVSLFVR